MLVALMRTIASVWRQEKMAENAKTINKLGQEIYERISIFASHYTGVGKALTKAVSAYNEGVGSLDHRVLSTARKFKELGVTSLGDIASVEPIDHTTRAMQTDLLTEPGDDHSDNGS
jgi:DNA recombination protein RmuC